MMYLLQITLITLLILTGAAAAFASSASPPNPLQGVAIPSTPGLLSGRQPIVVDRKAAIRLGKALFWDMNVGSDGVACGTCHFHAGADRRARNQLNSGQQYSGAPTSSTFEPTASGLPGGPDYPLKAGDFPLHQLADPLSRKSEVTFTTDDVVGSAGTFLRQFQGVEASGDATDRCSAASDAVFHLGSVNTRQVTSRNTPTVINAALNFRNFWDGRANNLFNGESAFGPRDPDAGGWLVRKGKAVKQRLLLKNAALASQAVAPPLNDVEMSCVGRTFPELGRKLIQRRPLERQAVHAEDSVFGPLVDGSGKGLATTYAALIRKTFARRYWAGTGDFGRSPDGAAYSQMEANFAFFFGLAVQLYEQTLISDQSLFDTERDAANVPIAFDEQQKRGLDLFMNSQCFVCHGGPNFTAAVHPKVNFPKWRGAVPMVNRTGMFEELDGVDVAKTMTDVGFLPTSVADPDQDIGVAGKDTWGHPLSFAEQYRATLADPGETMLDPVKVIACDFEFPFSYDFWPGDLIRDPNSTGYCRGYKGKSKVPSPETVRSEMSQPLQGKVMVTVKGAFKIPSLRNVELTGPYMHNGSMKSLEEVIQFYDRGGNDFGNPQHPETLVFLRAFSAQNKADLLAFLKTLTDERVRWERAPFDHPELVIPDGHDDQAASPLGGEYAADRFLHIPAVGRNGRTEQQGPLKPFDTYLAP
ncbi:MAG: conjugal transfer protein [Methylococcaceae bacterium]|nr:conjugal transfer protein [Methylococcaceae bacterium]